MRVGAYLVFEIVAWPAAAWCALELVLRIAANDFAGISATILTAACAILTIAGSRLRTRQLAAVMESRER